MTTDSEIRKLCEEVEEYCSKATPDLKAHASDKFWIIGMNNGSARFSKLSPDMKLITHARPDLLKLVAALREKSAMYSAAKQQLAECQRERDEANQQCIEVGKNAIREAKRAESADAKVATLTAERDRIDLEVSILRKANAEYRQREQKYESAEQMTELIKELAGRSDEAFDQLPYAPRRSRRKMTADV